MFSCPDCGQRYAHRSGLSRHRTAAHRAPRVACPHCPRAFGNAHLLRLHQRRVHARRVCEVCGTHVEAELWSFHASLHVHPRARADLGLNCASCCRLFHPHKIAAHERECREIAPQTLPDAAAQREAAFARYDALLADTETPWDVRLRVFRASECNRVTDDALWCGICNAVHWGRPPPRDPGSHAWQSRCKVCGKGFAHMQSLSRHKRRAHGGRDTPPPAPSPPVPTAAPSVAHTMDPESLRRLLCGFAMLR
jgi:hypothetical protein